MRRRNETGATPPRIELRAEGGDWSALGDAQALAERAVAACCAEIGFDGAGFEIGALLTTDAAVAALNATHRGRGAPTNVLSWPAFALTRDADGRPTGWPTPDAGAEATLLGDVALAQETLAREAAAGGVEIADHAAHLIAHAFLHLVGYDHETDADAAAMEGVERAALARIGVCDPYERA